LSERDRMVDEEEKKQIAVIGGSDFTTGFRLTGVNKIFSDKNYGQKIQELTERDDIGIVVAEQEDILELPERIQKKVQESVSPVVVALSESGTTEQINEKIRKVIGADIT